MPNFEVTYVLSEEVEYDSKEEALKESDDAATGIADTERLHIVSVTVEEV